LAILADALPAFLAGGAVDIKPSETLRVAFRA
jgi:hypothetical protein